MAGEIDGARGDAGPDPAEVATGVEFLRDGAAVHPENGGGGALPVRMGQKNGHIIEARSARGFRKGPRELCESVDHVGW